MQMVQTSDSIATSSGRLARPWFFLIIAFGICLRLVYFSDEIGGSHTFRQAMVANQIDTLKSTPYPGPKLALLERYDQGYAYGIVFFDTPIYQYVAARLGDFLDINSVRAARLLNLAIYAGLCLVLHGILSEIGLGVAVSYLTQVLLAVSPLSIQHTLGIYPDTPATLAAFASFYALLRYERERSWPYFFAALLLGVICTLIKLSIYAMFAAAYAWNLLWTLRWKVFRRIDAIVLGILVLCSVAVFPFERAYFNYSQPLAAANLDESFMLDWFIGPASERLEWMPWHEIGARFVFEYLFPLLTLFTILGLWRVIGAFRRKQDDPQLTLLGLVAGALAMILVFFNVFFRHDYYSMPVVPVYCVLTSIGLLYTWSAYGMQFRDHPKVYGFLAVAATCVCVYYAYSLRLLNYNQNVASITIGRNLQDLVPESGYVFYFQFVESSNPEFLYYARRRGVAADISYANNDYVADFIRSRKWNPDEVYLVAVGARYKPDTLARLKQRLDRYDLKEVGSAYDKSIVYKVLAKN
jgi:hypothetical protein